MPDRAPAGYKEYEPGCIRSNRHEETVAVQRSFYCALFIEGYVVCFEQMMPLAGVRRFTSSDRRFRPYRPLLNC